MVAGIFADRFFDSDTNLICRQNIFTAILLALVGMLSIVGFLLIDFVSGGVTAGYADAYSSYSAMSSWTNNFLGFFYNWFTLLGVSVAEKTPLVSSESIVTMIRIFGALLLLVVPVILVFRYNIRCFVPAAPQTSQLTLRF